MPTPPTPDTPTTPTPSNEALPVLAAPLTPGEVMERLEVAARRGRLAGFAPERDPGPGVEAAFRADAFGSPFDGWIFGRVSKNGQCCQIQLSTRLKPRGPLIWWSVLVLMVWPGLPITESMLASLLPQWPWLWKTTAYWYLPLTVPFVPWMGWSAVKKSRLAVAESAREVAGKIAAEVGGRVEGTQAP